jgi:hypothetical protein
MHAAREKYVNLSTSSNHTFTAFANGLEHHMPLSEQRKFKYTLSVDGFSTSARLSKLLATGQVRVSMAAG